MNMAVGGLPRLPTGALPEAQTPAQMQAQDPLTFEQMYNHVYGAPKDPNYGTALSQFGLALMSTPGDFLSAVGKAGQTALPLMEQERLRVEADNAQRQKAQMDFYMMGEKQRQKMLSDIQKAQVKLAADKELETHKASLKDAGVKKMGNLLVDSGIYDSQMDAHGDKERAIAAATISELPTSIMQSAKAVADMDHQLATLDPESEEYRTLKIQQDLIRDHLEGQKDDGFMMTVGTDGTTKFVKGSVPESKAELSAGDSTVYIDADVKSEIEERRTGALNTLEAADQLLTIVGENPSWMSGGVADAASTVSAINKAFNSAHNDPRYQELLDTMPAITARAAESGIMSPELARNLDEASKTRQAGFTLATLMAYQLAQAKAPGDRVTDRDFLNYLRSIGYDTEAWFQDPVRIQQGVETVVSDLLRGHRNYLRGKNIPDDIIAAESPLVYAEDYGFGMVPSGHGVTYRYTPAEPSTPAPVQVPTPAPSGSVTIPDDVRSRMDKYLPK